ncbi:MAG TPA: uridine diphosphate-N-acetylglucosamine-binding protein YvcK [Acidimicrobiales bacterium]|nr:uridine diphosphate-N-acetylglucosamine-binding protein YvcK [Acidimicrobiales bacterium]
MKLAPGGPRVVALGGGHGLAATLRAACRYAGDITAIVSVADDGGSSGRLRDALGLPAPGDLRRCLMALSDEASVWARALDHRFSAGELDGHSLGNLVIAGLTATTGDFGAALDEMGRLLGAVGRVLPATVGPVVLKADAAGGEVEGQVAIEQVGRIAGVSLIPPDAPAPPAAIEAILAADQIVLGPGSLFTSVLAAALVPELRAALAATRAHRVYVCNLRAHEPETAGYDVAGHVDSLMAHGIDPDVVVYDPAAIPVGELDLPAVAAAVTSDDGTGHDPARLAEVLKNLVG